MTVVSASARESHPAKFAQQLRALTLSHGPEALAVLRLLRTEQIEWPEEVRSEAHGQPITGMLAWQWGGWVYPVTRPVASLGRGLKNDLVLLDPAVSREHARVVLTAEGWWIENRTERNPLWVGEFEVAPRRRATLLPGETITLGNTSLEFLAPRSSVGAHPSALGAERAVGRIEDAPLTPLDSETGDEPGSGRTTTEMPTLELGGTNLLNPGVTLQFALSGKLGPRARWLLAGLALFVFVVSSVLTLGLASLMGADAAASGGLGHVLAALTIPLIPALGVALLVALLDRYEREPPLVLLAAFLWGAVIAIPPVLFAEGTLNQLLLAALGGDTGTALVPSLSLALSAGLTEETVKGAGLLLLLWVLRDEFDNLTDGVIYGALIGAGFAMVENFVFFAATPRTDLGVVIFGRVVLGWLGHSTFTALFGAGLGYAREQHYRRGAWRVAALGFVAGLLLHTFFDFVAFTAQAVGSSAAPGDAIAWLGVITVMLDYVPLFAAEALLLRLMLAALGREAKVVREYLAAEVTAGVVTPDEYVRLQHAPLRAGLERQYLWIWGLRLYVTVRSLHQTATGLAFRKWHVAQGDPPKPAARQPEDVYRARIGRLRRSLRRQLRQREGEPRRGSALPVGQSKGMQRARHDEQQDEQQ
jgi:RsiW-degrading membrane proteinase PrsW (M82 family)